MKPSFTVKVSALNPANSAVNKQAKTEKVRADRVNPNTLFLLLLFLLPLFVSGQNYLRVINPHGWWWNEASANINEAEITIRPLGAYVEYGLYLDISVMEPVYFSSTDQLEIILDFELPANSMITDSWLWIYGEPKQADIMDRWTATLIYESIVNRMQDPSLLVKNGQNKFKINIYPMLPHESRKIKITYLSPTKYSGGDIEPEFPLNIFNLSANEIGHFTAYFLPSDYNTRPFSDNDIIKFSPTNHPEHGNCTKSVIEYSEIEKHGIKIEELKNQSSITYYGNDDEGYYCFSFKPTDYVEPGTANQKTCFLVDYDHATFSLNSDQLIDMLKNKMGKTLTERDSFNVIFSNLSLSQAFDNWMPFTQANVDAAFNKPEITKYSNLIPLVAKGINYVAEQGGAGNILLITNNSSYTSISMSNDILSDINELNTQKIPISIIDYGNQNYWYNWVNSRYFIGNAYLYSNLSRMNGGDFISYFDHRSSLSIDNFLGYALDELGGDVLSRIDIYTKSDKGYSYGRTNISSTLGSNFKMNSLIHQIGRYQGGLPTMAEISFESKRQINHAKIDLSNSEKIEVDSMLQIIWTGLDIMQLEGQAQNNQVINEIIYQSIENRILSQYTAFLCVEDSIDISEHLNENGQDDSWVTLAQFNESLKLKTYPSPFYSNVKIEIPEPAKLQSLKIYNMNGQVVKSFAIDPNLGVYTWDGKDDLGMLGPKGVYIVVAAFTDKVYTSKITKGA